MVEKGKTNWKSTANRFIAFFDILGFKDKVMRKSHNDIYEELSQISKIKKKIESTQSKGSNDRYLDADVYVVTFSDSVVIFSKDDTIENFEYFLIASRYFFANAIKNKIPMKGGLAHGEISLNKTEQIYFGQPIIDAYLIEEDVNYLGVVAHNSIDRYIANSLDSSLSTVVDTVLIQEKAFLKSGKIYHLNVDWFKLLTDENEEIAVVDAVEVCLKKICESVSGSPRRYIDNTFDFFEQARSKGKLTYEKIKI